jgi:hypothetical protein
MKSTLLLSYFAEESNIVDVLVIIIIIIIIIITDNDRGRRGERME